MEAITLIFEQRRTSPVLLFMRRREEENIDQVHCMSVYLTPSAFHNVARAHSPSASSVPRSLPLMKKKKKKHNFNSAASFAQQCLPATGHLGMGIPWRDGTGCCHVIGKKRQSHHMPELLPSLYLFYGTPCKQQTPSNPLINYHVLTLI